MIIISLSGFWEQIPSGYVYYWMFAVNKQKEITQPVLTCLKPSMETSERYIKFVKI